MKFKPGDKVKCINCSGVEFLVIGSVYTVQDMHKTDGEWFVALVEYQEKPNGWYPWRFEKHVDGADFERFMERVMKPVKLDKPVTA